VKHQRLTAVWARAAEERRATIANELIIVENDVEEMKEWTSFLRRRRQADVRQKGVVKGWNKSGNFFFSNRATGHCQYVQIVFVADSLMADSLIYRH
jgi:hypothetical protein